MVGCQSRRRCVRQAANRGIVPCARLRRSPLPHLACDPGDGRRSGASDDRLLWADVEDGAGEPARGALLDRCEHLRPERHVEHDGRPVASVTGGARHAAAPTGGPWGARHRVVTDPLPPQLPAPAGSRSSGSTACRATPRLRRAAVRPG